MTTTERVFAEGDIVRVAGWNGQAFRIKRFDLVRGETHLWGGPKFRLSMRTVPTDKLRPGKPGDASKFGLDR